MDFLPLAIDGKRVYAGFWKRFCSIWVDVLVLLPFAFLFTWSEGFNRTLAIILAVPSTVLFPFYSIYFNARFGGTLGKLAVGIRITKPNGEKIGWKAAWLRSSVDLIFAFLMLVLTLWALVLVDPREYTSAGLLQRLQLLSSYYPWWYRLIIIGQQVWLWSEVVILLLNRRKRALHDFIAGTVVVHKQFVGIMSRRSFINADIVNVGRSRLNIALTFILIGFVILFGSIILCYSVWMGGNRDCPPPDTSDLVIEKLSLPDVENAYTYFNEATNSLFWPTNSSADNVADILRGNKRDDEFVRNLIANNDDTVAMIKEGLDCRICQGPEITKYDDPLPPLGTWRHVAQIMALKAMSARHAGQYAQSMQLCTDLIKYGGMIQVHAESIVQYLVGIAFLELGFEQSRQFANTLGVDESLLIELSDQISQMGPFDRGLIRSFKAEYKMQSNLIDDFKEGRINYDKPSASNKEDFAQNIKRHGWPSFLFQPNKTKCLTANHFRVLINNASFPYSKMKPVDPSNNELNMEGKNKLLVMMSGNVIGKILEGLLLPNLNGILEKKCKIECSAAATRLILTCKAYEIGMNELPDSLESLVPKYINSIPLDPYDGQPFKYSKLKAIVYSVGKDLKDSGGSTELPANETSVNDYDKQWKAQDIVFKIEKTSE